MNADWKNLFRRYGGVSKEADIRIIGYLVRPDCLTLDHIQWNDERAARLIANCEKIAEELKGYRKALAERYAALATMPYTLRLELVRNKSWKGPVTYWLRLVRHYEDGHEEKEQETSYPGNKRHEAIKAYQEMLKERPGIEAKMDIEKSRWEH